MQHFGQSYCNLQHHIYSLNVWETNAIHAPLIHWSLFELCKICNLYHTSGSHASVIIPWMGIFTSIISKWFCLVWIPWLLIISVLVKYGCFLYSRAHRYNGKQLSSLILLIAKYNKSMIRKLSNNSWFIDWLRISQYKLTCRIKTTYF